VRADDGRHSTVQPARERDLLAGRLGVDVDEDRRRVLASGRHELVDHLEHGDGGVQEERPEHVHDAQAGPVRRRDDGQAAPGGRARRVRRADDAVRSVEIGADLRAPKGVVAERDGVCARGEQPVRETWRDPDPVGRVLPVHDADVDTELVAERCEAILEGAASGRAHDVGDEEDAQERAS